MARYAPSIMRALNAIQSDDPDGGSVEPTEEMYAEHKRESIRRFGHGTWEIYIKGGWAERSDV